MIFEKTDLCRLKMDDFVNKQSNASSLTETTTDHDFIHSRFIVLWLNGCVLKEWGEGRGKVFDFGSLEVISCFQTTPVNCM